MNYSIYYYWSIGKRVYEKRLLCDNSVEKYSTFLSYYSGNSSLFTRENIRYMKRLYLNFPIFYEKLNMISWNQYKLLLRINNKKERFFYFYLSLLFNSDYNETIELINNNYYFRI